MADTLGQIIKSRREELGKTQRELARGVHISNATVSRIESDDKITPDNDTLKAIAEFLKLDYNYLLALNGQIDDQPEIRMIQLAAKHISHEQMDDMMEILKRSFKDAFNNAGEDKRDDN